MRLASGTRLGPYEVLGALGSGGMGEVYQARDTVLDRHVAVKVLSESVADDPDRLARFEREARALATLNHPNVAQVYGIVPLSDGRASEDGELCPRREADRDGAEVATLEDPPELTSGVPGIGPRGESGRPPAARRSRTARQPPRCW